MLKVVMPDGDVSSWWDHANSVKMVMVNKRTNQAQQVHIVPVVGQRCANPGTICVNKCVCNFVPHLSRWYQCQWAVSASGIERLH
jgi:2-iminoacetate synthase ThiH